jgi:hypothetical protein
MSNVLGPPTIAGYTAFLRSIGMSTAVLPDDSFSITLSFNIASTVVSDWLSQIDSDIYTICIYNLGADRLLYFAQDQPGQTFFANARGVNGYNLNAFVAGVISSSGDEATNQSFAVPASLQNLTVLDLENLRTPFGRAYISYAQMLGQGLWGLT